CVTEDLSKMDITNSNGQVLKTIYTEGVASRPSVSDDGTKVAFVNTEGHIVGIDILYDGSSIVSQSTILSDFPEWRSAAISKDGRYLAALTTVQQNRIYIYDLNDVFLTKHTFFLYNPTYSTGQITGEVQYADVLDFDYSGEYLMYDAYNDLSNDSGEDLSYWDIGFLKFLENGEIVDGANAFIAKLFSGLPEKTGVADPSFAKNSPYVIAMDVIDDLNDTRDILGANVETGDADYIVKDNGVLGWPSFNKNDNTLIFDRVSGSVTNVYKRALGTNKITGQGAVSQFIPSRNWGVWLANGLRNLMVDADEAAAERLQLTAAPNPATESVQLSFATPQSGPVRIVLSDLLGKTLLTRDWDLPAGNNQLDLNLQGLPSGTYALRVQAGGTGATLKVSKL
ncbi:MAG TPA: T9SS type A sorting domain-containing protein, partial [Saprospiraceae bacterium]|nr:T9SS type A sorting domain-containing protein [Saprospiraceae bacterium]